MRELYPAHYLRFQCTASACDFSCCREWKIYADDAVFRKWQKKGIRNVTRRADGRRVIRLTEEGNCPHLAEDGLCRLITEYGETLIPESCRMFPREIREYPDRTERSLMLACPAVIALLAEGFAILQIGKTDVEETDGEEGDGKRIAGNTGENEGGPEKLRNRWMQIIRDSATPEEAFLRLFQVPKDHPAIPAYAQKEEEAQLYADLTENYRAEGFYSRFWEEEMNGDSGMNRGGKASEKETSRDGAPGLWRTYTDLIMNCILSDVWSECLKPGFTEREMQLKLEWTALKYAAVRHFLRIRPDETGLRSGEGGGGNIEDEVRSGGRGFRTVRNGIVLMTRIMSMDDEEIFAWLLEMFDGEVWGPEYPALLFG